VPGGAGLYARVSCRDQQAGLDRQVARRPARAAQAGLPVVRVEAEVESGMNGSRPKVRRLLAGPGVSVVVAGHRGRLGQMNTELAEAALAAHRRRLVVLDQSEVTAGLVRDMIEVLTSFGARLHGRRPARNRALKAVGCTQRDTGPRAVLAAGSPPCGGAG
jgi:putative resolvase